MVTAKLSQDTQWWREPLSCPQSRQDRLSQTGACTFNAPKWRKQKLTFWIFQYLWISLLPSGNLLHFAIEAMVIYFVDLPIFIAWWFSIAMTPTHGIHGACVGHGQRGASLAVLGVHHVCTSVLHVPRHGDTIENAIFEWWSMASWMVVNG